MVSTQYPQNLSAHPHIKSGSSVDTRLPRPYPILRGPTANLDDYYPNPQPWMLIGWMIAEWFQAGCAIPLPLSHRCSHWPLLRFPSLTSSSSLLILSLLTLSLLRLPSLLLPLSPHPLSSYSLSLLLNSLSSLSPSLCLLLSFSHS